jgi:histidine kinase-like protein
VARQIVSRALAEWDLIDAEETTLLLVTELVSNGVRHANTTLTLTLSYDGTRIRIGVSDEDTSPPTLATASVKTHHGWGLRLIGGLSSNWGTIINPDGKTVWCDLKVDDLSSSQSGSPGSG